MNKPVIAVDIDDVLLPHFQDLISWYNKTYSTALTLEDNGKGDPAAWGTASDTEAIKRVHNFFDTDDFRDALPFADALTVLTDLSQRYILSIITARDTIIEKATRDWLEQHFKDLIQEIHFTAQYSLEGKARKKADILREIGASYLIDDSLENILAAAELGAQALLFGDYPWNAVETLPKNVIRCQDWHDIKEYFDGR